ncbi:MAG: pentapeptide repeat-containing protein [Candidatus Sericytochromatia bacterium]|nr:pentapeptide repeat-containing protein [Candidatus Sericytochromatia bacterium]
MQFEQGQSEQVQRGWVQLEQVQRGWVQLEQVQFEQVQLGQGQFEQVQRGRVQFERVQFERVQFERVQFGRVQFGQGQFEQVLLWPLPLGQIGLAHFRSLAQGSERWQRLPARCCFAFFLEWEVPVLFLSHF